MDKLHRFIKRISEGSIKYKSPRNINYKQIDKRIRKSIYNINKSNWCWTIWSCQGHNLGNDECVLPYLVFIVKNKNLNNLFKYLLETLPSHKDRKFPVVSKGEFMITKGFSDNNFTIVSIHWSKYFVKESDTMNRLHSSLNIISKKIRKHNA